MVRYDYEAINGINALKIEWSLSTRKIANSGKAGASSMHRLCIVFV
jgi:hypothetical protein